MSQSRVQRILLLAGIVLAALVLVACASVNATSASCAFVAGDGTVGRDAKLHAVVYPGQSLTRKDGQRVSFVPCNSRNFIINDGTRKDANGGTVGDRGQLIVAYTKTGVQIVVSARADWTLNQSMPAMTAFYTVCHKYNCASAEDKGGSANSSTPGWNSMLAENFGPAMDIAIQKAAFEVDDSVWQTHDPKQKQALADGASRYFPDTVRAALGFSQDLFCGSGNSVWKDPNKPGQDDFTCSPVRITVLEVERGQIKADDSSLGVKAINAQRLENAKAIYEDNAGYWLGMQDTIDRCKSANTTCVVNIGGTAGGPAIVPQTNNVSPFPVEAPAAKAAATVTPTKR